MEYVYAAMLLHKAGKQINEENLTQVLKAASIDVDLVRIKALVASLAEVNIDEAIKSPPTFMSVSTPSAPASIPEEKPKEKEKEKEEEKEEEALEGLGALFG
jgi:large subunit ribosomal protein L12